MPLIDTHVHLDDQAYDSDRAEVIARAKAAGVKLMINAGSTAAANLAALRLAAVEPSLYAGIGLHPHEFSRTAESDFQTLRAQLSQDKVVAVGEIGLDYHVFKDFPLPDRAAQQWAFREQLRLARIFELPLILHVREAYADALRILSEEGPFVHSGVVHCYGGGREFLPEILSRGFFIGIGGTSTYPAAEEAREVARSAPEDRILLETDAPYLPPQGRRGQRNEPSWLAEIAQLVAGVSGKTPERLASQTSANARALFHLGEGAPGQMVYPVGKNFYVNLTNRCSANCTFCPRRTDKHLHGVDLTLVREPLPAEIIAALGDPQRAAQIVFCGFGEPTLRLPALLTIAREIKRRGGRVRANTNGQADLIFRRDILPECAGLVDEWSVSLNSADPEQYDRLVRPVTGPGTLEAVQAFVARAVKQGFAVTTSAVELPEVDLAAVQALSRKLGATFRGRKHERLGSPKV